ncbi:diguanylate phosphodiesterase [Thiomicrorhabdus immobilis]|uniref:Diguanylate phosphodiesterase n=1 Tax=Thiomicrorhabdus immobilis TaxID=2791037 RepID=A0ABN6CYL8_9GAMM|nr:bifunctional diguanylate cyclase/phosphodiesterase [Thiomicrorhabdus immobilis]BCN94101.1 diguanylate phosphodiesterase [Thiomicrorhabdus immobilis]
MPLFSTVDETGVDKKEISVFDASQKLMLKETGFGSELLDIVDNRKLQCVFQPIVDLKRKKVCAFEGLVRGPFKSVLYHPLNLFKVAEEQGVLYEMDTFARISTIQAFAKQVSQDEHLHLFLNISINAVMNPAHQKGLTLEALEVFGIPPDRVVIEITELQPVDNFEAFVSAINYYRSIGFKVAIDDLGSGYNGLRIWSEVRPDFVKIDRHFVSDIHLHEDKRYFMETLMTLAKSTNTRVVAEGVETEQELEVLMKLGIDLVQGYLFKKPEEKISEELLYEWPENQFSVKSEKGETVAEIAFEHPVVEPGQRVNSVSEMFLQHPQLDYFPVVQKGHVLGMVWRRDLMDLLARKFGQELHARKTVKHVMDREPIIVDSKTSLVELSRLVTESREFGSRDAFIVEKKKKYLGCGDFRDLLRKITDLKVQSAQYANPLSGLPGNVPIQKKLNKLLKAKRHFMLMYIDVDNFKPFNDCYSFEEGDGVISLIAEILKKVVPEEEVFLGESFIGHIGGDDFVVMSTFVEESRERAEAILKKFQQQIVEFYLEEDQQRGGIEAENRRNESQFYPLMTLSIGILLVHPEIFEHTQRLASYATKAKKGAKQAGGNTYFIVDSKQA